MALRQDLLHGFRMFRKKPALTLVILVTLAIGIGANTAIFSAIDAILLQPLPYPDPDKLVLLRETFSGGMGSVSLPNLEDWRRENRAFTGLAAFSPGSFSLVAAERPERVIGASVSAEFFDVLGVAPLRGRTFGTDDDRAGNSRVAVLTEPAWRTLFSGAPDVVGKPIVLNGETYAIVGVMPASFQFPSPTTQVLIPLVATADQRAERGTHNLNVIGRIRADVSRDRAQAEMNGIAAELERRYPDSNTQRGVALLGVGEERVRAVKPVLLMLQCAVAFVLLIACTNVANLLLSRADERRREMAVRAALGADTWRLARQMLTESLVLALAGGAAGCLLAFWLLKLLMAFGKTVSPTTAGISLDARALAFALALSVLTGLGFGIVPVLFSGRTDIQAILKDGGRGQTGRSGLLRGGLVVIQVAAAVLLLSGTGLLLKSFLAVRNVESGLRPERVLTFRLTLPKARYPEATTVSTFHTALTRRIAALPGVERVGSISLLPVQNYGSNGSFDIKGRQPYPSGQGPLAELRFVSPDYFQALGVPLLAGRTVTEQDTAEAPPVVVVNQAFVRAVFPDENPLDRIVLRDDKEIRIVGVVADVRQSGLTADARPELYFPDTQAADGWIRGVNFVVRTSGDPVTAVGAIRRNLADLDPTLPIYNVQTMTEVIAESIDGFRVNATLLGTFALTAVGLALLGIYSVLAQSVARRTAEIGIRVTLGATVANITGMVLGEGLRLTGIGLIFGLAATLVLARLMESLLFGVTAHDPATLAAAVGGLVFAAVVACLIPARRAARVDPMTALRSE